MTCRHLNGVRCSLGLYGGAPLPRDCTGCHKYDGPARGAGDLVATVAKAMGARVCGGCQKRRELLNAMLPRPRKD